MTERELPFSFCPHCGAPGRVPEGAKKWFCPHCHFTFYQNNAAAVAVILTSGDRVVTVYRNRPPQKGMLDLPGGFVDPGESAVEAATRELQEELQITVRRFSFLTSYPNRYPYKGVLYRTCDLFFTADFADARSATGNAPLLQADANELSGWKWLTKEEWNPSEIAFESVRQALRLYFFGEKQ